MKNSILAAAVGAAVVSFATFAPAQAGVVGPMTIAPKALVGDNLVEKTGRRGRRFGYGALATLGVLGIIAANRHDRRHHYRNERRYNDYGHRCRRWRRWCRRGNDRACWKFDTRC